MGERMVKNLAETISDISRNHLENDNGVLLGQCLTAVGWVGGTVPEMPDHEGIIELSMADVMGGGVATGLALAGRRPIYVVRYQGFQFYNAPMILNYAAKSKEMWDVPCPVFVRSIGMDGGIGPVASGSHHGMYTRMPGVDVAAPITPGEYGKVWDKFMSGDDPVYCSEHRKTFNVDYEIENVVEENPDITLIPISSTRLSAIEAEKELKSNGVKCNIIHPLWLKPFDFRDDLLRSIKQSKLGGLVIDGDYEASYAKSLAHDLMLRTDSRVETLGLEDRTAGFAPNLDNLPPSAEKIKNYIGHMIKRYFDSKKI